MSIKYLYRKNNLKLIIEEDVVGYYLYVYKDIENTGIATEDYLLDSLEMAFSEAEALFGIQKNQWKREENS